MLFSYLRVTKIIKEQLIHVQFFPSSFTSWVESTSNRLNCSGCAFLVILIAFLCPVILPNFGVSKGISFFFFTSTGGRDSFAWLKTSHRMSTLKIVWQACQNTDSWAPTPGVWLQEAWGAARWFVFLTGSQVLLVEVGRLYLGTPDLMFILFILPDMPSKWTKGGRKETVSKVSLGSCTTRNTSCH